MNPIAEADAQALSETEAAFVRTLNADVQVRHRIGCRSHWAGASTLYELMTAPSRLQIFCAFATTACRMLSLPDCVT